MQKMRELVDANTIIGEPITTADGVTLIPVSKVSLGFAGGGSDFAQKPDSKGIGFGGGAGAGVTITPIAFVVAAGKDVDLMYITPPEMTTVDRVIEKVPEVLDKVTDFLSTMDKEKEKEQE